MTKINKKDLIRQTAERTGMKQEEVESVVDGFINVISNNIIAGNNVVIPGLFSIETRSVGARTYGWGGVSPAHKKVGVRVSRLIKKSVNVNV